MSILDAFLEGAAASYAAECARGEHDSQCKYDPRGFFLCHCKKRRRVAAGVTEPPADELYFPPPTCPRCRVDLEYDEGWRCDSCHLRWREDGTHAEFTDEYGDDLAQRSAAWKASRHLDADSEGVGS